MRALLLATAPLLLGGVVMLGGLTFFPVLALGPIAEHFGRRHGQVF